MNPIKRARILNKAMEKYQNASNYIILPASIIASYVTKDPVFAVAGMGNAFGTYAYRVNWKCGYENLSFPEWCNLPSPIKELVGSRSNYNDSFPISRIEIIDADLFV